MIDFTSHIEYLLLRHDCVVVPGLGAFLAHESEARYDAERGLFIPPCRTLGFNAAVSHNDGLLVESVARREGISIEAATIKVSDEVAAFRHQLAESGYLPVGSLGVMSAGTEPDALLFEPAPETSTGLRYAGLLPIEVAPLAEEAPEYAPAVEEDASPRPTVIPLPLKIAASFIIALVACGILYTTTNLVGSGRQDFAKLDSGLTERFEASQPVQAEEIHPVSREIVLNIARPAEGPSIADTVSRKAPAIQAQNDTPLGRYLLVVASLPSMKAAQRHIGATPGLHIINMDGKYRVYTSSTATLKEAVAEADRVRSEYPNVWVCKR